MHFFLLVGLANAAFIAPIRSRHVATPALTPLVPLRHKSPQLQPPPVVVMAETSSGGLKPRGLLGLLGGSLIHLSCGSMYCWGNLLSYMPPELKYWGGAAAAGSVPDAQFVLAFTILSQMVGMPIGPALERAGLGPRRTALLGALLMGSGVLLASFATSLATFVPCYCVLFGLGVGIAYQMPILNGAKWFPKAKGAVSGVVIFGMGASAFFFNMLATRIVNP